MMENGVRSYIAIDLKSFYASAECVARGLDPLTTNLVVADLSRTEKTICLAVTPSLKAHGIGGRARLFEVNQRLREVNYARRMSLPGKRFTGKSVYDSELQAHPDWEIDYITATPRMAYYIKKSSEIKQIYLKYVAPEDIHVYSIDEVFMDVTAYLRTYKKTPHELARLIISDVLAHTGITATAGIGTNMYLAKVAMDIVAKKMPADADGVRIAELNEQKYRHLLWNHRPLTAFWRVGRGTAKRLSRYGIDTMGKIARCSIENEELLYRLFGVNAELLIDHAWGHEPCTMAMVKAYRPQSNSLSNGQVLQSPYDYKKARVVVREMAEAIALSLVDKHLVTDQLTLSISYDAASLSAANGGNAYHGDVALDYYGRTVPKHVHSSIRLERFTSSSRLIAKAAADIYRNMVDPKLLIRRITIAVEHVIDETEARRLRKPRQLELFADEDSEEKQEEQDNFRLKKERRMQETQLNIKRRFGNNAILRGLNFEDGSTAKDRNNQIGGHRS